MPHQPVTLYDGVNVNRTPALNQFGISASQLIRYQYDDTGAPMIQKLGGWAKYWGTASPAPIRALWGWEDTNATKHLAYGTQSYIDPVTGLARGQLGVITLLPSGLSFNDITPTSGTTNPPVNFSTTAGSPNVIVTDASMPRVTSFDTVYIQTNVSVGGLHLIGSYPAQAINDTQYQITALDVLGNPLPATTTDSPGTLASYSTTSGSPVVTVTLANHGLIAGQNFSVLVATPVGGISVFGNYTVQTVTSANTFTIIANATATATTPTPVPANGGNARILYSFGYGPTQPGTGFGMGGFGQGPFGGTGQAVNPATGTQINANDWVLDNFGQVLLSCPINGTLFQPIYQWDPLSGAPSASVIPQAPTVNDGFFVGMPQRQVICWGSTDTGIQDPLLVRWCDVNNFGVWFDLPTNQAGKFRIPRGSRIVGGIQGPQQGLLWTDLAVWSMQYVGPPYVYSFNEIATGCGLISRKAAAAANGVVYWMGPTQFFSLTSEGTQPLACPIWDVAFQDVDMSAVDKIRVAVNSRFNEIAWHLPTHESNGEVAVFLKYNYALGWWDYGKLQRSAWIDQTVLGAPIGADPTTGFIYQHEISKDADGQPLISSFQTGYFALAEGDQKTFVDEMWPDFRYGEYADLPNAQLTINLILANFPEETPAILGPYPASQTTTFFNPRARARLFALQIESSDLGSFWRLGRIRYRGSPAGRYG